MKIEAVIFDFDGVLGDTMEDNFLAWRMAFSDYIEIREEDYYPLEGMKQIEVARIIAQKYGLKIKEQEIVDFKNEYYSRNNRFKFYKEIPELIGILEGRKLAIVSASPRKKLEETAGDFIKKFNVVISAEDTIYGKPNPHPYLAAIDKLKLNPGNCVVVENAPLGIKSAKAAGIYCLALTTTLEDKYLREADIIFNSHKELMNYFIDLER